VAAREPAGISLKVPSHACEPGHGTTGILPAQIAGLLDVIEPLDLSGVQLK
jgi:hypothetical protein